MTQNFKKLLSIVLYLKVWIAILQSTLLTVVLPPAFPATGSFSSVYLHKCVENTFVELLHHQMSSFRWVQMQATVFEMTIFKRFSRVSFSAVLICVAACLRRCLSSFKTVDLYKRFFFSWFDYSLTSWLGQSETL